MAECNKYLVLISCLADGEITESEKNELEMHMAACSSCEAYFKLISIISGVQDLAEPPASLVAGVMSAVKTASPPVRENNKNNHGRRVYRWAVLAACLALAIFSVPRLMDRFGGLSGSSSAPSGANQEIYSQSGTDYGSTEDSGERSFEKSCLPEKNDEAYTAPPVPAPSPSEVNGQDVSEPEKSGGIMSFYPASLPDDTRLEHYEAVAEIHGELPDFLSGYEQKDNGNGTYDIVVPVSLIEEFNTLNIPLQVNTDSDCNEILVIFTP